MKNESEGVILTGKEFVEKIRQNYEKRKSELYNDIPIHKSKFTPELNNGKGVHFSIGDVVNYRCVDGTEIKCTIATELMENEGFFGYEAIFHDDGKRYFAIEDMICDWEGKQMG